MPPLPPMTRPLRASLAALTATTLAATGCVGMLGPSSPATMHAVDLDSPQLRPFAVASMTDLERDVRIETGGRDYDPKLTPALFWTGLIVGSVGAVGAIGFGVAGFATKNTLANGYEGGDGLTTADRDEFVSRGEAFNTTAIVMTATAVLGYALALVAYGVDWNRCGPLVRKTKIRHCDVVLAEP